MSHVRPLPAPVTNAVSADDLNRAFATPDAPVVVDVRRRAAFDKADTVISTARWRGEAGGVTVKHGLVPEGRPSIWVTRERPKIDRIACPWFIRRFVDPDAVFHYVAKDFVKDVATETGGTPYDIPDVDFSHVGEKCSFDAFIAWSGIQDPAMNRLADIVRGADTGRLDLAPECAGLLATSLGLSALYEDDDLAMLDAGMAVYDALYAWARHASSENHNWAPKPA